MHNLAGPPYFDTIPPEVLLMDETVTVPALSSTTSATTTTVPPYIAVRKLFVRLFLVRR